MVSFNLAELENLVRRGQNVGLVVPQGLGSLGSQMGRPHSHVGGAVRPCAQRQKGKVKVGSCGSSYLIAFISLRFGEAKSRAENGEGDLRIRHGRIIWEGGREHGV